MPKSGKEKAALCCTYCEWSLESFTLYDRFAIYLEFYLAIRLFTLTPAGSFHAHMEYHYSLRYRIGGSMDLHGR